MERCSIREFCEYSLLILSFSPTTLQSSWTASSVEGPIGYLKWRGTRQANTEEAYLRASLVAGKFELPENWLAELPVERLLPGLRKIVRSWETHTAVARRQSERAARYARDRSESSASEQDS
eukprot:gene12942-biopygen19992